MQYDVQVTEDQQELIHSSVVSDETPAVDTRTPIENQIVGYKEAQDQYAIKSAG